MSVKATARTTGWLGGVLLLCLLLWAAWPSAPHHGLFPPDRDGDLIRDDVGQMIAVRFAANPAANAATRQLARAWQLAALRDAADWPRSQRQVRQAIACMLGDAVLGRAHLSAESMYHFMQQLHAAMFDSPARLARWRQFEAASAGMPHEDLPLNPCVFDPAALAG
ncbi:hypothetical protein ACFOLG_08405 [Vogesella facilis]|uniref:Uncharacterized protein n=1 Tax=Vogesella facilis TaxID=1655232 RepID=A0ABV7RD35_9NEIS